MVLGVFASVLAKKIMDAGFDGVKNSLHLGYEEKLRFTILQTLETCEAKNLSIGIADKKPFYFSDIAFQYLMGFVLFAKPLPQEPLRQLLEEDGRFEIPNENQVQDFFDIFYSFAQNDSELAKLFIDENYKARIFEISQSLETLHPKLDSLTTSVEALRDKVTNPQYLDWIKQIKADILAFKPLTAVQHLEKLEYSMAALGRIDSTIHAQILLLKGMCFYEQNEFEKGEEAYLEAWSKDPSEISIMEKALRVFVDRGKFDAAQQLLIRE